MYKYSQLNNFHEWITTIDFILTIAGGAPLDPDAALDKLSITTTISPSLRSSTTVWLPINPAPPVTSTAVGLKLSFMFKKFYPYL